MFVRLTVLVVLVAFGLGTKSYDGPGEWWIRGSSGGVFYVAFWTVAWLVLRPRTPAAPLAAIVTAVTCGLEFLQQQPACIRS